MDMYDTVKTMLDNLASSNSLYSGCEIIKRDDGGIIIRGPSVASNGNYPSFTIGIPANYQENTLSEVVYFNGWKSDNGGDTYHNGSILQTDNVNQIMDLNANTVVITGTNCYDNYDVTNLVLPIQDSLNMQIGNSVCVGFSDGGTGAARALISQINRGKTNGNVLLLYDSSHLTMLDSNEVNTLANGNTTVILVHQDRASDTVASADYNHGLVNLIKAGIPVVDITAKNVTSHNGVNTTALQDNVVGYILGIQDAPSNSDNYEYGIYDPTTNTKKVMTVSELKDYFIKNGLYSNLVNLDKYTTSSSYEVKNVSIVASNFYNQLSSIDNLSSSKSIISSDSTYVIDAMNSIRSQIKATASNCSTATTVAGRFSSGILASIGSYVNKFYNVYGNLLSSLEAETKSIVSLSEAIDDMNLDLQNGASAIGTFSESANPYLKVEDTLVTEETTVTSSVKRSSGGGGGSSSSSSTDTTQQETTVTTPVAETPVTTTESSSVSDIGIVTTEEPVSEEVEVADDIDMDISEDSTDAYIPTDTTTSSTVTSSKKKGNTLRTVGIIGAVAAGAGAAAYGAKEFIDRKNSNSDFEDSSDNDDIDDDDDDEI